MRLRVKLSKQTRAAFKRYYDNRRDQGATGVWNKEADLDNIFDSLPKNCIYYQACAGTFWLTWKRPAVQTTHDEVNYWCCKVLSRRKKGVWKHVK